jgi:hypothetical protein
MSKKKKKSVAAVARFRFMVVAGGWRPGTRPPSPISRADRTGPVHDEVHVFPSQERISVLADRLEQAYLRRYPDWSPARTSRGVWTAAASGLSMLHRNVPSVPVDPELFVAVQPTRPWADPWADLAQESALRRYRRHVRRIIAQLRDEIRDEVRAAERRVRRGSTLAAVLADSGGRFSALGRYVLARRAGQDELAERLRPEAERQHRSCPLYQQACRSLLPNDAYPLPRQSGLLPGLVIPAGVELPCFSMN